MVYLWCILWLLQIIFASALAALDSDLSTPPRRSAICIDQVETENTTYALWSLHGLSKTSFGCEDGLVDIQWLS